MQSKNTLKKVLKPIHLWALAVGLVISGEYFGWNYGWNVSGTIGFLIATIIITILYVTFIFSFTELTASIPDAGGPFAYSYRALGPLGGFVAGYATLVEFLFAPPAIAFALGSYMHFLYPLFDVKYTAYACYLVFTLFNLLGIKETATFSLFVTILAVAELMIFMGIVAPHFKMDTYLQNPMPFGITGIFAALPFAIWFYVAIEGVAMVAEEVKDPKKNIPIGYISGILTLVLLALGVMIFTGGITSWQNLSSIDYPLPEAIGIVLGKQNDWTQIFAGIGLFGLIASFHGIIISYSRQIFALARSGYLPSALSQVNRRFGTPHWALVAGGLVGIISIFTGTTDKVIILSVLGAVCMYIISMVSLFILRKKEPFLERPFKSPLYPWFPAIALLLSFISLLAIAWYNVQLSVLFFAILIIGLIIFMLMGRHKNKFGDDILSVSRQ
ncbi:MAG TPA: ethanolamine permease [Panacibacter sp.]|nr:ethanolamine permease [Panacibacter sp.]